MLAVPIRHRAFAVAFTSLCIHSFGDVPSPIITGYMKDKLAPDCAGSDDQVSSTPACRDDEAGLRLTMLIVSLWLFWSVFFFSWACYICQAWPSTMDHLKREEEDRRTIKEDDDDSSDTGVNDTLIAH